MFGYDTDICAREKDDGGTSSDDDEEEGKD